MQHRRHTGIVLRMRPTAILPGMQPQLIADDAALSDLLARLAPNAWVVVDTEFVRERTYFAQLCLVQIGDADTVALIDALAVDLAPLWTFLRDPARLKVLHSASQDMELFVQHAGDCPRPLFDTQIAAAMLGLGDQISYAALVEDRLGVTLDKSQSRTDWSARPLKPAQLDYAADDVRQLARLFPALRDALATAGREDWHREDCDAVCDPARYRPDPEHAWQRLRGLGRLDADAQQAAAQLARWREERAVASDRPRRWLLADDALLAIASARPDSVEALRACAADIPPKSIERNARTWLRLIAEAPTGRAPLVEDFRPDGAHRGLVKQLSHTVRARAETLGVPPSLLAARASLEQLARFGAGAEGNPAMAGWRREQIGDALIAALDSA